jgi:NAD(P)-dependent dehydrogenase (short-subunit alcohol dehydrogenase family)
MQARISITFIDVLTDYCAPGIMHPADDNALNTEEKIWDLTMTVNLKGVWWGCKYAILAMRENRTDETKGLHTGGSIINTASFVALVGAATPQLACEY